MINERNQKLSLPITTKQLKKKLREKEGKEGNCTKQFKPAQSDVFIRREPCMVVPAPGTDSSFPVRTGRL